MRRHAKIWLFLAFLLAVACFPSRAAAQQSVRCESNDGGRHYCGQYSGYDVQLARQISGSACIQGSTWGVDQNGLWVDRGCRAEFTIAQRQYGGQQQPVRCESNDGERHYCGRYERDEVLLARQLSDTSCIEDSTWGVDRDGLWVDRGCRADFTVAPENDEGRGELGALPEWVHPGQNQNWPPSGDWRGGNWDRGGACFYKDYNYSGDYFCMRRGESLRSMGDFGGNISSIRVFGGARVTVYNDPNYRNGQDVTDHDVPDLHAWHMSSRPSHTWNKRISSLKVR